MNSSPHASAGTNSPQRPPGVWTDPVFARTSEVATAVAGLVFSPSRQPSAESAMRRVMSAYRLRNPAALLQAVSTSGEVRDALLAELTVGESYFLREPGQLGLLGSVVLPAWREEAWEVPRRIWSAGCAAGEEPYSLAILLRESGWTAPVRILGTDIARPRLDAARRGRYTKWALRGMTEARLARWFTRRGPHFQLHGEILDAVDFRCLNLASDEYPSAEGGTTDQDLILCRNVLIYFDLQTVSVIAERLLRALRPNGWLVLGASDPPLADLVECELVMTPAGAAYRRYDSERVRGKGERFAIGPFVSEPRALSAMPYLPVPAEVPRPALVHVPLELTSRVSAAPMPPPARAPAVATAETPAQAYARGDYESSALLARGAVERDPHDVAAWLLWIRSVANGGELVVAGEICARALERHRLVPELHYLHGLLLVEAGRSVDGAAGARRALYLDRTFVLAYMLLGDALARLGDHTGAGRAFENAARLLAELPDAAAVPASDGVPVARLRQMTAQRLQSLAGGGVG